MVTYLPVSVHLLPQESKPCRYPLSSSLSLQIKLIDSRMKYDVRIYLRGAVFYDPYVGTHEHESLEILSQPYSIDNRLGRKRGMDGRVGCIESTDSVDALLECVSPLLGEVTSLHAEEFDLVQSIAQQCTQKPPCIGRSVGMSARFALGA